MNEKDKEIERLLALNKELRNEMKVQKARNIKIGNMFTNRICQNGRREKDILMQI